MSSGVGNMIMLSRDGTVRNGCSLWMAHPVVASIQTAGTIGQVGTAMTTGACQSLPMLTLSSLRSLRRL